MVAVEPPAPGLKEKSWPVAWGVASPVYVCDAEPIVSEMVFAACAVHQASHW